MLSSLIKDLNLPSDIPVIIGGLGDFVKVYKDGSYIYFEKVNETLKTLANELPRGAFADAKGLNCKYDGIHFDSKSYREFGKRYFKAYLEAMGK